MNRVQLLKPVTTFVVLTMMHTSNALAAPGRTGQDPVAAETPPRPQATADHSKPRHAARVYLDQATSMLDAVPEENLDHDARKLISVLRKDFSALTDSYRANAKADREEARETINGNVAGAVDWHARFSDVERRLAEILGGGSSFSPSYTPSGPFASSVAAATSAPATQGKAASSPASATLVAPATTVVTPAVPAGEVAQAPSVSAAAAGAAPPAVTTTPPPAASISPQSAAASAADPAAAAATTPPGTPVGVGSATAATATAGGTVAGTTGAGAAAVASVLVSTIGLKNLDPAARLQLEQFRTAVELFFDATTRLGS